MNTLHKILLLAGIVSIFTVYIMQGNYIFKMGKSAFVNNIDQTYKVNREYANPELSKYNELTLSGSEVIQAINKYKESNSVCIIVVLDKFDSNGKRVILGFAGQENTIENLAFYYTGNFLLLDTDISPKECTLDTLRQQGLLEIKTSGYDLHTQYSDTNFIRLDTNFTSHIYYDVNRSISALEFVQE